MKLIACIAASAAMTALYARGGAGWMLGFVFLAPWMLALEAVQARRSLAGALLCGWGMSVAFTAAAFGWFGAALGRYTQIGEAAGVALLLLFAPLFQPQFLAYALVRHAGARWLGAGLRVPAAVAAWVAVEWLVPRMLGDTLGYGLYPSRWSRQAADLFGTAGLTLLLLLANEGMAAALAPERRAMGWRSVARRLALAGLVPLGLAAYGALTLAGGEAAGGKPLRMGLVQANMVDYEGQRQQKGAYAFVREVLDRHFAMSHDARMRQGAEALLWSETAYPTTFGNPKSEAGAEFDAEIRAFVEAAGVPLVFGTYERDGAGEYNAAAFLQPGTGLTGFYRKTRLFPFTEYVPAWLDVLWVRSALPWSGSWTAGNGARVRPLRLRDGREIPVLPLICRDDVDPGLAIAGARLGAQIILTMSNDSWFSGDGPGAYLHQAAAAFRSIETRLPQFRVTSNGYSAAIDANGEVLAGTPAGAPALVIADLPVQQPAPTLMVLWGDWVGAAASVFLLLLAARAGIAAWRLRREPASAPAAGAPGIAAGGVRVYVLQPRARLAAGVARALARAGLLGICIALLLDEGLRSNTLALLRLFAGAFLVPEVVGWCVLLAFTARATVAGGKLVLVHGAQRMELGLGDVAAVEVWRLPLPAPGLQLRMASGAYWRYGLAVAEPMRLAQALELAGVPRAARGAGALRAALEAYTMARNAIGRWRFDHPLVRFGLLPLLLALPAFHLHQHIAYGSALGEYYSFGWKAYVSAFALWWAAWTVGVALGAAVLRTLIEACTLLAAALRPEAAGRVRGGMESAGQIALYLGLPAWLLLRIFGG
ncbi:apolipoprotein N-acyltransferase [Pseudoduganella sp. OTU4001]|uniref:apolipoprotein N-acyltransferase n=1 Tax=Pseudoduganella sp. OTU4001 TaxID=3043854 RepID=UPI00313EB63E